MLKSSIFCSLIGLFTTQFTSPQDYLVSLPYVLRSGDEHVVSIDLPNVEKTTTTAVTVSCKLYTDSRKMLHDGTSVLPALTKKSEYRLLVPSGYAGRATFEISGTSIDGLFNFSNKTTVTITGRSVTVFVQTDKPYYKPKHIVHARFYVVDAWLKPKRLFSGLNVYVDDPKGSRIVQKFDLSTENDCGGVSNFQFQLADETVFGEWTIFAEVDGFVFNSTFVVANYELPKYSLKIRPPSYFLALNECQNVQVVARYTFGKNVSGELIANMTIEGYGYYNEKGPTLEKEIHIMDGVGHFQVCVMDLLPVYRGEIPTYWTGKLHIWATMVADDGRRVTAHNSDALVHGQPYQLEFSGDTRKHFKPGIPFVGHINVKYPDGSPAKNVRVHVQALHFDKESTSIDLTSPSLTFWNGYLNSSSTGLVTFNVDVVPADAKIIWLRAQISMNEDLDNLSISEAQPIWHRLNAWWSPSNCYILAEGPGTTLEPHGAIKVIVKSNCPCDFDLNFEIVSRGNIISTGRQNFVDVRVGSAEVDQFAAEQPQYTDYLTEIDGTENQIHGVFENVSS